MEDKIASLIVKLMFIALTIPVAFWLDKRLHKRMPQVKPYKWGYYIGVLGIVTYGDIAIGALSEGGLGLAVFIVMLAICYVFYCIIKREKWAWVVGTVMTLNPVMWMINYQYFKNRRDEYSPISIKESITTRNIMCKLQKSKIEKGYRVIISGAIIWCLSVFAYVSIFSPYGESMWEEDMIHMAKVLLFPPVVVLCGYLLYRNFVSEEKGVSGHER